MPDKKNKKIEPKYNLQYGKGSGSGTITQGSYSVTENLSTRIKKKLSSFLKMKKGGSFSQHD
tara:strand:+ start:1509 stop:1694 length:186 start_codon:yes stop_codon:yes gene_type:complete